MKNIANIALIDFEFTGLDNTFVTDNEIVQVKIINLTNGQSIISNFTSHKNISAYARLSHKVERYESRPYFTAEYFKSMLETIELDENKQLWGFGVEQDIKMLNKYGINDYIHDIRTEYQKSKFAYRMATEGSSLESTFLIVTGKYPPENINHADLSELLLIKELYLAMNGHVFCDFMSVVPFGHCAGMSIEQYALDYRRNADGYRFNNTDEFACSLDHVIWEIEYIDNDEDFKYDHEEEDLPF